MMCRSPIHRAISSWSPFDPVQDERASNIFWPDQ
jgi:hypothetical protein